MIKGILQKNWPIIFVSVLTSEHTWDFQAFDKLQVVVVPCSVYLNSIHFERKLLAQCNNI